MSGGKGGGGGGRISHSYDTHLKEIERRASSATAYWACKGGAENKGRASQLKLHDLHRRQLKKNKTKQNKKDNKKKKKTTTSMRGFFPRLSNGLAPKMCDLERIEKESPNFRTN